MTTLILKDAVIVAASPLVNETETGYSTPDAFYPWTSGITGTVEVSDLPADFAPHRYQWVDGALVRKPDDAEAIEAARTALRARLAQRRWEAEVGGLILADFDDVRIDTSRESQAMMSGALLAAQYDVAEKFDWKIGPGKWVEITSEQLVLISKAVAAHVQACFSNEHVLESEIAAATSIAELNAVDLNAGWE